MGGRATHTAGEAMPQAQPAATSAVGSQQHLSSLDGTCYMPTVGCLNASPARFSWLSRPICGLPRGARGSVRWCARTAMHVPGGCVVDFEPWALCGPPHLAPPPCQDQPFSPPSGPRTRPSASPRRRQRTPPPPRCGQRGRKGNCVGSSQLHSAARRRQRDGVPPQPPQRGLARVGKWGRKVEACSFRALCLAAVPPAGVWEGHAHVAAPHGAARPPRQEARPPPEVPCWRQRRRAQGGVARASTAAAAAAARATGSRRQCWWLRRHRAGRSAWAMRAWVARVVCNMGGAWRQRALCVGGDKAMASGAT
eukprot:366054-Chlamydomonas_euryale.AAC.5